MAMDPGARESRLTDPAGGVTRLRHNQMEQVVQRILPGGGREQRKYDPDGLLESVTLPMGDTWKFSYDRAGQLLEILFPAGEKQQLSYDKAGRLAGIRYPAGGNVNYGYDPAGLLIEIKNARGQKIQYGYDEGGRVVSKKTAEDNWSYRYDSGGNLVQATNGKFTLRYTYDALGQRVQTEYVEWGKTIQYRRDKFGRIESRIDPDGNKTSYTYDRFGQISRIEHTGGMVFDFEYTREGRLTKRKNPNGTVMDHLYDPAGRIDSVQHRNPSGEIISSRTYKHDLDGNRVEIIDEQGRGDTFQYDQEQKIIGEKGFWGWRNYVYGHGGQRISVSGPSLNVPYLYDDQGMLLKAGEEKFGYDRDGNLISRAGKEGATLYSYDGEGNLIGVELPGGKKIAYGYGPFRERIWRDENGKRTYYLLDGSDVIQELSASFEPEANYLYGGLDQPLMVSFADGKNGFFHQDILGSILAISDSDRQVVARYSYDAFGRVLKEEGAIRQTLRFTGRPFDPLTGLYDLRARFYDPKNGRFISRDPLSGEIDDPMTLSPYLYVRNNPLSYPDPFGLDPFWVPTPDAPDLFDFFTRQVGHAPMFVDAGHLIMQGHYDNPQVLQKRLNEHVDFLRRKFGQKTAEGFQRRGQKLIDALYPTKPPGLIARTYAEVVNRMQGAGDWLKNKILQAVRPSWATNETRGVESAPPDSGGSGAQMGTRQMAPSSPAGASAASSSLGSQIRGTAGVSGYGNLAMTGGDVFGETFDIGTMSFTDDAFQNMSSTARNLAVTSAVGAVGVKALSVVGGAAVATGGAVVGAGLLAYGAVNRTRAAMNEASRMQGAWRRETANQARTANTENSMSDRYIDDLNSLQAKSRELEALRPQIQGADGEIRSLELEAANKRNAVQAALEKIDGLAGKIRDADATLKSQIDPAGGGRNDPGTDVLMNELQELKRKACEAAASLTGISDPAEKTRKLEEAKNYARDAAKKAEEISKLKGASQPQGDSSATQETLKTMENTLLEMEEIYSAIEADTRGILERVGLIEKKWELLERAWTLQAEILLNLNLRKNFSDPLGEFAALRQIVSNPLPPKEGLKELLQSAKESLNQAKGYEQNGNSTIKTTRELINEAKKKVPSATSPGVSPAQDPALLAQQAQACVTEGERQASGTGSERGTDEATTRSTGEGGGFQSAGEGTTGSSGEETVSPDGFGPAGMGRTEGGSGLSLLGAGMSGMSPAVPTPGTGESSTGGFGSAGAGQTTPGTGAGAQPAGARARRI